MHCDKLAIIFKLLGSWVGWIIKLSGVQDTAKKNTILCITPEKLQLITELTINNLKFNFGLCVFNFLECFLHLLMLFFSSLKLHFKNDLFTLVLLFQFSLCKYRWLTVTFDVYIDLFQAFVKDILWVSNFKVLTFETFSRINKNKNVQQNQKKRIIFIFLLVCDCEQIKHVWWQYRTQSLYKLNLFWDSPRRKIRLRQISGK